MRLSYQQLNELYRILNTKYGHNDEYVNAIGKAINLVDECNQKDLASIYTNEKEDQVVIQFIFNGGSWPDFLINETNSGYVELKRIKGNKVKVIV